MCGRLLSIEARLMMTSEKWVEASDLRTEARRFFNSEAGRAMLQMLYRARKIPTSARSGEEENGMRIGWDACLIFLEGLALAEDHQIEQIDADFPEPEKQDED